MQEGGKGRRISIVVPRCLGARGDGNWLVVVQPDRSRVVCCDTRPATTKGGPTDQWAAGQFNVLGVESFSPHEKLSDKPTNIGRHERMHAHTTHNGKEDGSFTSPSQTHKPTYPQTHSCAFDSAPASAPPPPPLGPGGTPQCCCSPLPPPALRRCSAPAPRPGRPPL